MLYKFTCTTYKKLVNNPLNLIRKILEEEHVNDISLLQNCKGEFKDIGFLFEDFVSQKKALKNARDLALLEEQKYHSLFQHMLNGFASCKMVLMSFCWK